MGKNVNKLPVGIFALLAITLYIFVFLAPGGITGASVAEEYQGTPITGRYLASDADFNITSTADFDASWLLWSQ